MDWEGSKALTAQLVIEKDALHIYAAFAIQITTALALRWPLSSWRPWLCVLAVELANEFLDVWLSAELTLQVWQVTAAGHDLVNTMILPTALLLLCRYGPPRLWIPQSTKSGH